MSNPKSNDFNKNSKTKKSGFHVDIRAIHDRNQILETLHFDTRQGFADFCKTKSIRSDGYYDLTGKDLSNLDLTGARFCLADFNFTNFTDSILIEADLLGANLTNVNLKRVDLTKAETATADVGGADLSGAIISKEQLDLTFGIPSFLPDGSRPANHPTPIKKNNGPLGLKGHLGL